MNKVTTTINFARAIAIVAIVAIASFGGYAATTEANHSTPPCDVNVSQYDDGYYMTMEVREGHGGLWYFMEVDGMSNENRGWDTRSTVDGYAFVMPYSIDDSGSEHEYEVRVGHSGHDNPMCESIGGFSLRE